jgi:hypothetical protein
LLVNHHSRRRRRYIPWEFNASTDIGSNNICRRRRRRRYIPWEFNASTEEPGSVKQVVEENR